MDFGSPPRLRLEPPGYYRGAERGEDVTDSSNISRAAYCFSRRREAPGRLRGRPRGPAVDTRSGPRRGDGGLPREVGCAGVADTPPLGPGGGAHNLIIQPQSSRSAFMR